MKIITRSEAMKMGYTTYYTGRVCRRGHDCYRYTASSACAACISEKRAEERRVYRQAQQVLEERHGRKNQHDD